MFTNQVRINLRNVARAEWAHPFWIECDVFGNGPILIIGK